MLKKALHVIFPRRNRAENLGFYDALDDVEMLQDIERSFSVRFSAIERIPLENVGSLFEYTQTKRLAAGNNLSWEEFVAVISKHSVTRLQEIRPETEFYKYIRT